MTGVYIRRLRVVVAIHVVMITWTLIMLLNKQISIR